MTLYLTDLDGTLLNYAAKLKPRACDMLNRMIANGVQFSYATARGFTTSREKTAGLKLALPIITMNGAVICSPDEGKPLTNNFLGEKSLSLAMDFFKEYGETPLVYSFLDGAERVSFLEDDIRSIKGYLKERKNDKRFRPCKSYDELYAGDIYYFTFINPKSNLKALQSLFKPANGFEHVYYEDVYNRDEFWFEIYKAGVSKAAALLQLKELVGADKVIAFGDNLNDISMFKAADECYAVANAREELKAVAAGIIGSNEAMGVPVFIEKRETKVWDYTQPKSNPDRFRKAVNELKNRGTRHSIGEQFEKPIHAALKHYFSAESDREAKIGSFIADVAGENGIYEIQTSSWSTLNKKLAVFLEASHVTVVYPFEQRVHHAAICEKTGELLKKPASRNYRNFFKFFYELYGIKSFLTHPNLTVVLCGLEIEKTRYIADLRNPRKRSVLKPVKKPLALLSELYLECGEDYRMFIPENLPEQFTAKQFGGTWQMMEVLEYMSVIRKCGKKGNEFLYCVDFPD